MEVVDFIKLGGTVNLNLKENMRDWYSTISLSYHHTGPFFQGFDYEPFRQNLNIEDSIYIFLSVYKNWNNLAYIIQRLTAKGTLPTDLERAGYSFESPSDKFKKIISDEKVLAKEDWHKEFSEEKINSLKKEIISDPSDYIKEKLKGKSFPEYHDVLSEFKQSIEDKGIRCSVNLDFVVSVREFVLDLSCDELNKKRYHDLLKSKDPNFIHITVFIDRQMYRVNYTK